MAPEVSERSSRAPGEIIDLTLTGMAPTGEAIGRYAGGQIRHGGFVPFGLPGEEVRVHWSSASATLRAGEIVATSDRCGRHACRPRLPVLRPLRRL